MVLDLYNWQIGIWWDFGWKVYGNQLAETTHSAAFTCLGLLAPATPMFFPKREATGMGDEGPEVSQLDQHPKS